MTNDQLFCLAPLLNEVGKFSCSGVTVTEALNLLEGIVTNFTGNIGRLRSVLITNEYHTGITVNQTIDIAGQAVMLVSCFFNNLFNSGGDHSKQIIERILVPCSILFSILSKLLCIDCSL